MHGHLSHLFLCVLCWVVLYCVVLGCVVLCCVGSGFCDKIITRSEEDYQACVTKKPLQLGGLGPIWAVAPQKNYRASETVLNDFVLFQLSNIIMWSHSGNKWENPEGECTYL